VQAFSLLLVLGADMEIDYSSATIESDALRANLLETAGDVEITPQFMVLLDVVEKYAGLHQSLEKLLYEVCHPFRNWKIVLPHLRSYALKNISHYRNHDRGPEAFHVFSEMFLEAVRDTQRDPALLAQAISAMMVWLEKMIDKFSADDLDRFGAEINVTFDRILTFDRAERPIFMEFIHNQHPLSKIAAKILSLYIPTKSTFDLHALAALMRMVLTRCYEYWLQEDDPLSWFLDRCSITAENFHCSELFEEIAHAAMKQHLAVLAKLVDSSEPALSLEGMLALPDHIDIVKQYRAMPNKLGDAAIDAEKDGPQQSLLISENRKLLFLFRIMDTKGLYLIHEETLREINRSLVQLIRQQSFEEIEGFLLTAFELLKANVRKFPHTSLQCIQVLGGEVFDRGNSRMVEAFLWGVVRFGFQHAGVVGVDENWQPLVNPAHLANIRVWLYLIMREPKWCSTLFSALIIHLKLSGTCIKDTDLFQRDITQLLNNPIEPIYNLAKQFTKLMPVFYNEIGSEGELRDVSTELDEIHRRKDVLIHFLRKQGHVESSNLIVDFIEAIFLFWKTGNKALLIPYIPEEVYSQVRTSGEYLDEQQVLSDRFWRENGIVSVQDILTMDRQVLEAFLHRQEDISQAEVKRFGLLVRMYKLLHKKYNLGVQQLRAEIASAVNDGFPEMERLLDDIDRGSTEDALDALLSALEVLKDVKIGRAHV
jgi:pyruvate,orthophosphate dikinase